MNKRRLIALVSAVLMLTVVCGMQVRGQECHKNRRIGSAYGEVAQYGEAVINAVKLAIEEINKMAEFRKQIKFMLR